MFMAELRASHLLICYHTGHLQGDRVANIKEALKLLPRYGIQVGDWLVPSLHLALIHALKCDPLFTVRLSGRRPGLQVARQSRLYESAPAYVTDQPRFVNAALAVETALPPIELLAALKRIEVHHNFYRSILATETSHMR